MLSILSMSRCLGTVSKALFLSIVVNNLLYAGFTAFRPSSICQ